MRRAWSRGSMVLSTLGGLVLTACPGSHGDEPEAPPKTAEVPEAPETPADPEPDSKSKLAEIARTPAPPPEPELLVPVATPPDDASSIKVALPPVVSFSRATIPERYPDGAYSIDGLRKNLGERIREGEAGTEILVRAYVNAIYTAPSCPPGAACPVPKQPHVWTVDDPSVKGRRRAMMVVNYRFLIPEWDADTWKDQPEVVLETGKQYTFKGKFKMFSDTGFADDDGLLEFVAYRPHDPDTGRELSEWVYPPGAAWHPISVAQMEEQNAKLMEAMAKEAKKKSRRSR